MDGGLSEILESNNCLRELESVFLESHFCGVGIIANQHTNK